MDSCLENQLKAITQQLRRKIIYYSHYANIPHLGSCLSLVEILTILYFHHAKIDPKNPYKKNRDRIILSKGHGAPALFQTLALAGFFPEEWMFREDHGAGLFGEHPPTPDHLPGIEAATGSLGHGLSMAVGMAISAKIINEKYHCFAIVGDGECNEGTVWEAAMFASGHNVNNLTVIVDYNKWQATGRSDDILDISNIGNKFKCFGFDEYVVDGHNLNELSEAITDASKSLKPCVIVANTIKGKGVSFMEDDNNWHYKIPNEKEIELAFAELN